VSSSRTARGASLALLSALSFGATAPLVARFGEGIGAFSTAALLCSGACLSAVLLGRIAPVAGAPIERVHVFLLVAIAIIGAGIGSTLLAWGLQRAGATTGSLLLNLEAVFTVLLARALYREPIGRRVVAALAAIVSGGAALALDAALVATWSLLGALAIAAATAAWALDSTLMRRLAERDPVLIVAGKGGLGAVITGGAAWIAGEPGFGAAPAIGLVACGATGFGLSLRLYVLAQRNIGAARTGAIFAVAPFVGAALAWVMGDRAAGAWTAAAAALFALGAYLIVTERHAHAHVHPAVEHDHPHRHDDGHHDHVHAPPFFGEHSHPHHHDAFEHDHEHGPDIHHEHAH